jgi:hypothetical protein
VPQSSQTPSLGDQFEAGRAAGENGQPWTSVAALSFEEAAARTHSPSDQIAFHLDAWLVEHPEACATAADYPGWADEFAAIKAAHTTPVEAS